MMREVRREVGGAAHGEYRCSSLRVRWWWVLTMKSHGVEISIAGCVEEMVRDPNPMPFCFFLCFFFFIMCFVLFNYWEQRLRAALGMVKKEPYPHWPTRRQGKSHQPKSLWYQTNRTPAAQNRKSNPD